MKKTSIALKRLSALFAALLILGACSEKEVVEEPTITETTVFSTVSNTAYDSDLAQGITNYSMEFSSESASLNLMLVCDLYSQAGNPLPSTGTYSISDDSSSALTFTKSETSWSQDEETFTPSNGSISVSASSSSVSLSGYLEDELGNILKFSTSSVSFTLNADLQVEFFSVKESYYEASTYYLSLLSADESVNLTLGVMADDGGEQAAQVPAGTYSTESNFVSSTFWTEGATTYTVEDAMCVISYPTTDLMLIQGYAKSEDGRWIEYQFKQSYYFGDESNPYVYTTMSGTWQTAATDWLCYDYTDGWIETQAGTNDTVSILGIPQTEQLLVEGIFDPTYAMLISQDEEGFYISATPVDNTMNIVAYSGTDFYVYPTLVSEGAGYYIYGGKIRVDVADQYSQMNILPMTLTSQVEQSDGTTEEITVDFEYFGGIGMSQAGQALFFINYNFMKLPAINKMSSVESVPAAYTSYITEPVECEIPFVAKKKLSEGVFSLKDAIIVNIEDVQFKGTFKK